MGAGQGTDNQDFLADLSALEVINPDAVAREESQSDTGPIPESPSPLLTQWTGGRIPYAHCAWCAEEVKTMSLENHYYTTHQVVLQPSCCSPPYVFPTTMGMELQLRQANFGPYSEGPVSLRPDMDYNEAKDIVGAQCIVRDDKKKEWCVRMPRLEAIGDTFLVLTPELTLLPDDGQGLHEYMQEPTDDTRMATTEIGLGDAPN